jgi:hypothetical protein
MVACAPDRKMARKPARSGPLAAAAVAGLAGILTLGARTWAAPDGTWLGILPPIWIVVAVPLAALGATVALPRVRRAWPAFERAIDAWPAAGWSAVAIAALPWLPVPMPAAAFVWLGPLKWLAWIGALLAGLSGIVASRAAPAWLGDRRRGGALAFAAAVAVFAAGYACVRGILPGGDEPHYLIIADSIWRDGDLAIDDNHARGDYLAYFRGELPPDYLRRGEDRRIYSIHAPGLPVLLLPAFAAFGYAGAVAALIAISAWGARVVWRLVLDLTGETGAAWFAWAAVVLAAPVFFHAFTIFPDGVASVCAALGVQALVTASRRPSGDADGWRWFAGGLALAILPWLHTRAVVIALVLGAGVAACLSWRGRGTRSLALFVAAPVVSAAGWFGYFRWIYGTWSPAAPYGGYTQTALANVPAGVAGLLFDAQFGLMTVAPVFALAVAGLGAMLIGGRRDGDPSTGLGPSEARAVGATIAVAFVAYVVASASYRMWWGGASAPARFLAPMLLPLGVPIGLAWSRARGPASRALAVAALVVTAFVTLILAGVDGGRLAYGSRDAAAAWARWASPAVDLARALPRVHLTGPATAALLAGVWVCAAAAAWVAIARLARGGGAGRARAFAPLVIGVAATVAVALAWRVEGSGAGPLLAGGAEQAALAAWQAHPRATLVEGGGFRLHRVSAGEARARLVLPSTIAGSGRQLRIALPPLVPGRYRLTTPGVLPGPLALRVGRSGLEWRRLDAGSTPVTLDLDVPVALPGWAAWPIDPAAVAVPGLTIAPIALQASAGGDAVARQVVRYGAHDVFFLDDDSYPEAPGFWVRPGRSRMVVGGTAAPFALVVRNVPVANRVELAAGGWRQTLDLAPGQEVRVEVPPIGTATPLEVRAAAGFRPFDGDPRNRDFRLLGVWIALE